MTPSRSRRPTRSATAGADRPTRRPSSANAILPSRWSSSRIRRLTASSRFVSEATAGVYLRCSMAFTRSAEDHAAYIVAAKAVAAGRRSRTAPPDAFFVVSAAFHYLGPAFAVLLFAFIDVFGVA